MVKDTQLHIRINRNLKLALENKCGSLGIDLSNLLNTWVEAFVNHNADNADEVQLNEELKNIDQDLKMIVCQLEQKKVYKIETEQQLLKLREQKVRAKAAEFCNYGDAEQVFLRESARVLEANPQFIDGRVSLFNNRFNHQIGKNEFLNLIKQVSA